jgi:hypothetical protein
MPVERGKIREYASATGATSRDYLEDELAPIPPTFLSTVVFWDQLGSAFSQPEAVTALASLGIEGSVEQLLSAEQEYVFHGPLPRAGDQLTTSPRFDGVDVKVGKRGGQMVFLRYAIEFRSGDGELRAECIYTSVYTSKAAVTQP